MSEIQPETLNPTPEDTIAAWLANPNDFAPRDRITPQMAQVALKFLEFLRDGSVKRDFRHPKMDHLASMTPHGGIISFEFEPLDLGMDKVVLVDCKATGAYEITVFEAFKIVYRQAFTLTKI